MTEQTEKTSNWKKYHIPRYLVDGKISKDIKKKNMRGNHYNEIYKELITTIKKIQHELSVELIKDEFLSEDGPDKMFSGWNKVSIAIKEIKTDKGNRTYYRFIGEGKEFDGDYCYSHYKPLCGIIIDLKIDKDGVSSKTETHVKGRAIAPIYNYSLNDSYSYCSQDVNKLGYHKMPLRNKNEEHIETLYKLLPKVLEIMY